MVDVKVQPHADRIGGNDVVDFAILEQGDLLVARLRAQCTHDHCGAATKSPQHFGHAVDLLGTKSDDRASGRKARQLARPDVGKGGEAGAIGNLCLGNQLAHQWFERGRAQQHRFLAPTRIEQMIGKDMPPLAIRSDLGFVQSNEGGARSIARHRFGGTTHVTRAFGLDTLFAGYQRHGVIALDRANAVIDFASKQAKREAHAAAGMRGHALDRQMRLAGIGGSEDCLDSASLHVP